MDNQKKGGTDEIDLGQLFQKIAAGVRDAWMSLMRLLALLRRVPIENKFSFIGIIAVSVALAIAYSFALRKDYYESTMILNSTYLNKRLVENTINKLDVLAKEKETTGLAKQLNISDTLADNITGFESRPFINEDDVIEMEVLRAQLKGVREVAENGAVIDQVMRRIEVENRHSFEITIRTLNPSVLGNLQEALVAYIRDNEYVKRRIEINRSSNEQKKAKLLADLQKIDSLKSIIYANYRSMADGKREGSNNVILSERAVTNPIEVFNADLALYNNLQEVERELYLRRDFEVVDGFTEFSEPASPSAMKMVLWAVLLGIIVAYLDVAVRRFNQYLSTIG